MDGVRVAQPGDRAPLTSNVAAAFSRDPAWAFLLGDDYERLAPLFAGALFDTRVGSGTVWVTGDLAAVAMWEAPGSAEAPGVASDAVWKRYRAAAGEPAWERLSAYERALDTARPSEPHWYLGVLATRPDRQGEGLATAVMAPVLEKADGQGVACCLETSTMRNRRFYERRGFTEVTPLHIESGPPTWWLQRAPRSP
jgi:GNAT superfamily N-acetyltransferase